MIHHTDKYLISRGSSIDVIERCAAFIRQSADFKGILDYADEDGSGKFQEMIHDLNHWALRIIQKESR